MDLGLQAPWRSCGSRKRVPQLSILLAYLRLAIPALLPAIYLPSSAAWQLVRDSTKILLPRHVQELCELKSSALKGYRDLGFDEGNIFHWHCLLLPDAAPYNKAAYKIDIIFPAEYPFKPPKITFKTKIYHPNIDEKGQVCLPIISAVNWRPSTKTDQVLQELIELVNQPEVDHPLRANLADEYTSDPESFCKKAEEYTKKYGEKRSADRK